MLSTEPAGTAAPRRSGGRLALHGGPPVVAPGTIEERWPLVEEEDIAAVTATLRSGRLSWINNQDVPALEEAWAGYIGSRYCLAFNSGTAALHAAVATFTIKFHGLRNFKLHLAGKLRRTRRTVNLKK